MWSGGGNTLPAVPLPASPASLLWQSGRERGKGEVQYLFLLASAPTLFRNTAARPPAGIQSAGFEM